MKNYTLKRLLCFLMAVSMVMSIAVMPAAATEETTGETTGETEHTCAFTTETARTEPTCGAAGSVTKACSCGETQTQEIPATGEHSYENGVCAVCTTPKPCTLAVDCDANTHVEQCLSQCTGAVNCENGAHKEDCLSQADCTCVRLCADNMCCPVCEGNGECKGGEAADRIAAVQELIDALPTQFTAEQRQAVADQYAACTEAIGALTEAERGELDMTRYYAADQATEVASEVDSLQELKDALAAKAKVININANITVSGKTNDDILVISGGVTINGGGNTVTSSAPRILNIATSEAVIINNLKLEGDSTVSEQRGINVITAACDLKLNTVSVSGASHYAVNVASSAAGNGKITIQNSDITGYSALNISPSGYTVTVTGSTLTGYNPFKYHDTNAYAAIVVNSGSNVTVTGGSIIANTTNGNIQAIVTTSGSGNTIDISSSTTLTLQGEKACYILNGAYDNNNIKLPSADTTVLASQKLTLVNGKVTPILNHEDALIAAVNAGGTVVLEDNITLTKTLVIPSGKTVILNLNEKTISQSKECTASYEMINNKGSLTITGNGKLSFTDTGSGDPNHNWGSYTIRNEGTLVVENGTIEHLGEFDFADHCIMAIFQYSGSTTIKDGTIRTPSYRSIRLWHGSMTIDDGTMEGQVWVQTQKGDPATLTIKNGTFAPVGNDGSSVYVTNDNNTVTLTIENGIFNGKLGVAKPDTLVKNITGGTFKNKDGSVFDITAFLAPGYQQNTTSGAVSKADMPAVGSDATSKVDNTSGNTTISNAVSTVTGNTEIKKVDSGLDNVFTEEKLDEAVTLLQADENNEGKDLTGTTICTTVSVTLEDVGTDTAGTSVTTLTYEVKPQLQAVNQDGDVVATATIPNDKLNNQTVSFRLPVVGTEAGKLVSVSHEGKPIGLYTVQGTGSNLYIDVDTKAFSTFTVTILDASAKPIAEATIGEDNITFASIDEAIAYIGTNSGKLKLLENVSTGITLTVASGKTVTVDLNGKEYTYTGSSSAFINNGTALTMENGTVKATGTGTLVQNTSGALTITGITYTGTSTSGYAISATGGTATIASGNFTGNAYSVYASDSGAVTINGGTFNKGIAASASVNSTKNVTINGGTFQAETNAFNDDVNGESAASGIIYIPGTVSNSLNPAQFKVNPPAAMIETNYEAVLSNGMYKIQKKASFSVGGTENHYGANDSLDTIFTNNKGITVFNIVTNKELKNEHKDFSAEKLEINFNGNLIYGGGSITAASGKSIFLNDIGPNRIDVVLGPGDKAVFGTDGSVTITAAENKNINGQGVGYGEVLLTVQNTSNNDVGIMYFLGRQATLTVNANGTLATTGQVITGAITATKPIFTITQVDNGTSITSSFVYGSDKTLTFSCNAFFEGLVKVSVDDKDLATTAYTAKAGSTIVTLNNSYLKTLTKGTHKLTMHFLDGQTASANFYVVSAAKPTWNPQTGDMIMYSVMVMGAAAAGLAILWYIGKKKKK